MALPGPLPLRDRDRWPLEHAHRPAAPPELGVEALLEPVCKPPMQRPEALPGGVAVRP